MIHVLPAHLGRTFAPGMAKLQTHLRLAVFMREVDNTPKAEHLLFIPQTRAPWRDTGVR